MDPMQPDARTPLSMKLKTQRVPRAIVGSYVSGLAVFTVTFCLYAYALFFWKKFVVGATVLAVVGLVFLVVRPSKSLWLRPASACLLFSVWAGLLLGWYCFDKYVYFADIYAYARTYNNQLPSEPADSVLDAGTLTFSKDATLDRRSAYGYSSADGHMYCVVPVRDSSNSTGHIEFWAVGVDCCSLSGSFTCDDASDSSAHSGVVIFDNVNALFRTQMLHKFDTARMKAEAAMRLSGQTSHLYIRWFSADGTARFTRSYTTAAIQFTIGMLVLYCIVFPPITWLLFQLFSRKVILV